MRVFVASGLVVLVVISGCASQMTREKAKEHCAAQGKRPFIAEAEQQGVPLFIESANVLFYCVGPDDILSTPAAFGAQIVGGADLHGVGVMTVSPGSIADKAGLKAGDILYEYAGRSITRPAELQTGIQGSASGDRVPIKFRRNKREMTATAQF